MSNEKLAACPFCGGEAKKYDAVPCEGDEPSVGCDKCNFYLSNFDHDDCVAAWNTRTPPTDAVQDVVIGENQVADQYRVVAHLARSIARVHEQIEPIIRNGVARDLDEMRGERSAHIMENLGDILNEMDAVDPNEDGWMSDVFQRAHEEYSATPSPQPAVEQDVVERAAQQLQSHLITKEGAPYAMTQCRDAVNVVLAALSQPAKPDADARALLNAAQCLHATGHLVLARKLEALSRAQSGDTWQDGWRGMESAPRDGTHILAYESTGDAYRAAWDEKCESWSAFCGQYVTETPEPELWMPWSNVAPPTNTDGSTEADDGEGSRDDR